MKEYRYLIVGAGMTADAACRGIREHDPAGTIGVIGDEPHPPYRRPPLSKGLWQGKDEAKIWYATADLGVDFALGRTAVDLDLQAHLVRDNAGDAYRFERLLLATGSRPRRLPVGGGDVIYFRTLDDYRRLHSLAGPGKRFAVIGGGFIGSEVAAALRSQGSEVTMVFPEDGVGAAIFPADLSAFVTDYYRAQGVEVAAGCTVTEIDRTGDGPRVKLSDGRVLDCDGVVAGVGVVPRTELAAAAGLPVDDGIVVDAFGRVGGRDDVFAAGDVARFPSAALGVAARVEHEDHALTQGKLVGGNMAGGRTAYEHLPYFYSDLFDLGYEAVGEVTRRHPTAAEWKEPFREGVVYYLDGERVRGVLLWNTWGRVDEARRLIRAGARFGETTMLR